MVATKDHNSAVSALQYSTKEINFCEVLFISDKNPLGNKAFYTFQNILPFKTVSEWGKFVVFDLHNFINTEYILLIHEDGFIVNPKAWDNDWLDYDYVGAPFPLPRDQISYRDKFGTIVRVGNSVSLRSKRLLELPSKIGLEWKNFDGGLAHEDGFLCVQHRHILTKYGIKYAPFETALRFGREVNLPEHRGIEPFTFHTWQGPNKVYPCFNKQAVLRKKIKRFIVKIMERFFKCLK